MTRPLPRLLGLLFLLQISFGTAAAQLNTGTTTLYFSFYHQPFGSSGAPNIHVSGWGKPGDQSAHGYSGDMLVALSAGATSGVVLPILFMGEDGTPTTTHIIITFPHSGDVLDFTDGPPGPGPVVMNTGRTGTATLNWGTGSFHNATGFYAYTLKCGQGCAPDIGQIENGGFDGTMGGSGQLNLPTAVAMAVLPNLFPPPPTFLQKVTNNLAALVGQPTPTMKAVPGAIPLDTLGGSSGSPFFSVTPTLQPTAVNYTAAATCSNLSSGCWLSVPSASGTIPAFGATQITANANPTNLPAGVYPADFSVALTPSGSTTPVIQDAQAVLILNGSASVLQLSETAIQIQTLAGAGSQSHSIRISNSTSQPLSWSATASELSGGNWLTVTPGSGVASASSTITIAVNPAGLAAGSYFGRVDISAAGAAFSPQSVMVQLTVAAGGAVPTFSTTGLTFVAAQNTNPAPQSLKISTLSAAPIPITAGHEEDDLMSWFSIVYTAFSVSANSPVTLTTTVDTTGLTPGTYTGTINVQNSTTLAIYPISVLLVVTPPGGQCTPTQLLPVITSLGQSFELLAGVAVSLQAQVVDDCGSPLTAGVVQASLPGGDGSVVMAPLGNGQWAGTWEPHEIAGGPTSVLINAQSATGLQGSASVYGTLDPNATAPVVNPGGMVSAASLVSGIVAPGEFLSIFGSNLATSTTSASSLPLTTSLAGTQVLLGDQPLPLQFVSPGQINAIVPFETPVNGIQQLLIKQNNMYALPETLIVATESPAVFTQAQSGQGPGVIVVVKANGTQFVNSASQPASAGDALVIYCAGLGAVSPAVADGMGAPNVPLSSTVDPVTVTVGGQNAQVLFAGLAPGFPGLYQVNVVVPTGVTPGSGVPVVLTAGGFPSPPVTVAIH